jgi:peptide/nickel transport system permease protein
MTGFLIRRILQTLLVTFLVTVFTVLLVDIFPGGGPIHALLGPRATPEQVAYYNRLYGFDQPFYVQYLKWVGQILHGNLGFSIKLNQSVSSLIAQDLPKTIVLVALGTLFSLLPGVPLGLYQPSSATPPATTS